MSVGKAIYISSHTPGCVYDKAIFCEHLEKHEAVLEKSGGAQSDRQ